MSRNPYRFVASSRRGAYSVWRGDAPIGYVDRVTLRVSRAGQTAVRTVWVPTLPNRKELAAAATRDDAADALWNHRS